MNKRSTLLGALAMGCMLLPASGFAQYTNSPFYDHTVALSQAYGLEALGLRLDLATAFSPPYDEELAETIEGVSGLDHARFKGTLEQRDSALATALAAALADVADQVEEGGDAVEAVSEARELLGKAYALLIPADLEDTRAFKAGVIINLLLAEGGVAEGYEEAVENSEPWEYPSGWAALQRVKALWAEVAGPASPQQLADGEEMLELLDTLYPQAEPPASVAGLNPEEAESPAQRLGGIVETVADADLYPGRDLGRLAGHLSEVTAEVCSAYAEQPEIAAETIYAVYDLYAAHLAEVAVLFASDAEQRAVALFASMIGAGGDDDDSDGAPAVEEEAVAVQLSAADGCAQLSATLVELKAAFGG